MLKIRLKIHFFPDFIQTRLSVVGEDYYLVTSSLFIIRDFRFSTAVTWYTGNKSVMQSIVRTN